MTLVDTGFFLALAQPRDALHQHAVAWSQAITDPLIVTEYVLWETVNSLSRPADRPRAHLVVDQVRAGAYQLIPATPAWFEAGLRLHAERPDKEWSLTDCISICVMRQHGIRRILSHDHHFEQAGFEALLRRDP